MPRTLIVENELQAQRKIARYLDGRGVAYDLASAPMEAISRLTSQTYDYLFLDLDLGAGISDGIGLVAWMARQGKIIPTLVISEASAWPSVIRMEKAYPQIIKLRMTHSDLDHLGDLVDQLMTARAALVSDDSSVGHQRDPLRITIVLTVAAILFLGASTFVAVKLSGRAFTQVIVATLAVVILVAVAGLVAAGRISEKSFVQVVRDILKKLPTLLL